MGNPGVGFPQPATLTFKIAGAEKAPINLQEMDFTFHNAPGSTRQEELVKKNRLALQGTLIKALYARDNLARFEAYDEMESRAKKLYDEISIEGYKSLSNLVRCLDIRQAAVPSTDQMLHAPY